MLLFVINSSNLSPIFIKSTIDGPALDELARSFNSLSTILIEGFSTQLPAAPAAHAKNGFSNKFIYIMLLPNYTPYLPPSPELPPSQLPCQQGKPKLSILRKRSKCFFWHQLMPVNAAVCARIWYTCCPFIIHTFTHMYVRVCVWVYMVLSPMWNRARRYNIHSIIAVHFTKTETFLTDRSITDIFCGVHWDVADHYPHSCPHSCSHCLA